MGIKLISFFRYLDKAEIAQTVRDCCVSESAINYYQQQIKESLATEPEVEVV